MSIMQTILFQLWNFK